MQGVAKFLWNKCRGCPCGTLAVEQMTSCHSRFKSSQRWKCYHIISYSMDFLWTFLAPLIILPQNGNEMCCSRLYSKSFDKTKKSGGDQVDLHIFLPKIFVLIILACKLCPFQDHQDFQGLVWPKQEHQRKKSAVPWLLHSIYPVQWILDLTILLVSGKFIVKMRIIAKSSIIYNIHPNLVSGKIIG